ncbi:MAG: penicillin-binding protein 1C [Pseudomonadota bacterium]
MRRRTKRAGAFALTLAAGLAGWGALALDRAIDVRAMALAAPETGLEIRDREGLLLAAFPAEDDRWRLPASADDVDPRFVRMLLAWEDKRFLDHGGIDPRAVLRAAWQAVRHRRIVSGASTLTMQAARLSAGLPTRSLSAKVEQALTALALERTRDKAGILATYLTLAPYGGNLEGVRAASLAWFGKAPRRLTAAEAALLVALPQSPERTRPDRFPERAKAARDRVLHRMAEIGEIDAGTLSRALAEPIPAARRALPFLAPHTAMRLREEAGARARIDVTLDARLQSRLETYALERARNLGPGVSLALLVADPATGALLASIGAPDLFDASRDGHVDLTRAVRSPGSTLKPFIYGLAFERGLAHPESLVDDSPGSFAGYRPENFDARFEGLITARRALQLSRNLPAVELLSRVGPSRLVARLRRGGAVPELGDRSLPGLAIGLGGVGLTLRDLVGLYAGLANGGAARPLHELAGMGGATARLLSAQSAWYVASILAGAKTTAKGSPGEIALKTGTSYGHRDAWAIGFDGAHAIGVWIGRPDGAPVPGLLGAQDAVPVLRDVFARLGPPARLPGPPPGILASSGAGLPPAMRRVGRAAGPSQAHNGPQIVFPPDAARVEVGGLGGTLALKARDGRPPYTWYVDGAPITDGEAGGQTLWRAGEPGFVEIAVVDSAGAADRARVRLD